MALPLLFVLVDSVLVSVDVTADNFPLLRVYLVVEKEGSCNVSTTCRKLGIILVRILASVVIQALTRFRKATFALMAASETSDGSELPLFVALLASSCSKAFTTLEYGEEIS